jgi:dienelactone hydrolase
MDDSTELAELFIASPGDGFAAVVVIGGTEEGVPARGLARYLASCGYAALATAPERMTLPRFEAIWSRLQRTGCIDMQRIALLGVGQGAEHALAIAAEHSQVRAVVAVSPGAGEQLPVERIAGPILLVAGIDDQRWPAMEIADQIIERLRANQFAHGVSLHSYGNAGHWLFGPPIERSDPRCERLRELGGTLEGNATARADSWRKALNFLEDSLRPRDGTTRPVVVHDDGWSALITNRR